MKNFGKILIFLAKSMRIGQQVRPLYRFKSRLAERGHLTGHKTHRWKEELLKKFSAEAELEMNKPFSNYV